MTVPNMADVAEAEKTVAAKKRLTAARKKVSNVCIYLF
jgi:hypothetical protein